MNYTIEDFKNARFAEHPRTGELAFRTEKNIIFPWETVDGIRGNDEGLSGGGWVPVPTKPTLTDSQLEEACGTWYESDDYLMGFISGFEKAGGQVIDEPTDEQLLAGIIRNIDDWQSITSPELLAKYLNTAGVTANKENR